MSLILFQVIALVSLIAISLFAVLLPSFVFWIWRKKLNFNINNCKSFITQNVTIELFRSFDCGILISSLFLHLIPQTRKTFQRFFHQLSATNFKHLIIVKTDLGDIYEFHGIPLVELMICLSFFGIYFCEEFIQSCLRYRKFYWFSNPNIMYSNGIYEFTSLDYRLNKTRHYLIACSRKTSEATSVKSPESGCDVKIGYHETQLQNNSDISILSCDSSQPNSLPTSLNSETTVSSHLPSYWQSNSQFEDLKVYLPQLTLATSMPMLSVFEGIVIASQETFGLLCMVFAVVLFHKIITAFVLSFEIYEKTNCKMMPINALMSFTFLPAFGFLIVIINNVIFMETFSKQFSGLVFSVISAGSLLQIVFICIRNNYIQFVAPLKHSIVHHFTMYTGFIVILTLTAFINVKNTKSYIKM